MRNTITLFTKFFLLTIGVIIIIAFSSCSEKAPKDFVINGEITSSNTKDIKLEAVGSSKFVVIDTAQVENGKFTFRKDLTAGLYRLRTDEMSSALYLYARNGDKLNVKINGSDATDYEVSGNEESEQLRNLTALTMEKRVERKEWRKSIDDFEGEQKDSIQSLLDGSVADQDAEIMEFIDKVEDPVLAAFAIQLLTDLQGKMDYVETTLIELENKDPESEYIRAMSRKMANYKNIYEEAAAKAATKEGGLAPEIALPNTEDEIMKLTDLRGKVVLLDFWASWCRPCRYENPRVVAAYKKYKDQGFDVYSVSLDRNKDKWIRAIEHDGLIWDAHVSDLKHWRSEAAKTYKVGSIPATFLLDRDGRVIAKNLRGAALDRKLEEIFGS